MMFLVSMSFVISSNDFAFGNEEKMLSLIFKREIPIPHRVKNAARHTKNKILWRNQNALNFTMKFPKSKLNDERFEIMRPKVNKVLFSRLNPNFYNEYTFAEGD